MTRPFLTVYYLLGYYLSFLVFGVVGLVFNVGCLLVSWLPATPRTERFFQQTIHRLFAFWIRWLSIGRLVRFRFDHLNLPADRRFVLVANHPGLMDVTYLLARVPDAICFFKPAIGYNPVLGAAARQAGYLSSSDGHDVIRAAAEKVRTGCPLIVFPEGTRSRAGKLNPLKPGFALVARRAAVPIQLVRIACDSDLLVKGRAWWKLPRLPAQVSVTLGPCLPPPLEQKTSAVVAEVEAWFRAQPTSNVGPHASATFASPAGFQTAS